MSILQIQTSLHRNIPKEIGDLHLEDLRELKLDNMNICSLEFITFLRIPSLQFLKLGTFILHIDRNTFAMLKALRKAYLPNLERLTIVSSSQFFIHDPESLYRCDFPQMSHVFVNFSNANFCYPLRMNCKAIQ